ncbi:MAG: hypothetical protein KF781_08690 [Chitinophagaceae bacterium]|nr:hypothetical protein [Chitinophagaceae bacterium]MCW5905109.1 hypothetical protein [Chitinophagaceae bacterium]
MATKNKNKYTIIILTLCLLGAIGFIVYQNYPSIQQKIGFSPMQSNNQNTPINSSSEFESNLNSFFQELNSNEEVSKSQIDFFNFIKKEENFPSKDEYLKLINTQKIPTDYKYFFNECFPSYLQNISSSTNQLKGTNILFSSNSDSIKSVYLLFNKEKQSSTALVKNLPNAKNRIVISGTYTSPYSLPAGLAVDKGETINPYIQKWDGLLLIDKNSKPHILNIEELSFNFKSFKIKSNFSDYLKFVEVLKENKISIIQSHLIVYNDTICVEKDLKQAKTRRRAIFETKDKGIHIFDSFDKNFSLYELADYVIENYGATRAINIDMGDYNYCKIFENSVQKKDYSTLGKGVTLSNFIVIDY